MLTILTFKQKNGQDRKVSFRGTGWIFYYTKIQPVRSVLAILRDLLLYVPVPWSAQHGQTPTPGKWQLWCSIEPQNSDCPEQLKDTRHSFRMRHYFLEWSLCHAFTCISCGLFVTQRSCDSTARWAGEGTEDVWFEALSSSSAPPACRLSEEVTQDLLSTTGTL